MGIIAWDSTPTAGDCYNSTSWANMVQYIKHSAACDFTIYDDDLSTSQKFKFSYSGSDNTMAGDDTTAKKLILKATSADTYPYISLDGNSHTSINIGSAKYLYINENAAQLFLFAREGNYSDIIGHLTTGKNMRLKANIADDYPRVDLIGNAGISENVASGGYWNYYNAATRIFTFGGNAADLYLWGGGGTGFTTHLYANATDTYPKIDLIGNSAIRYYSHNDHYFYADAVNQMKITGSADCNILGPSGTGADLILTCNQTDSYPKIRLYGDSDTIISLKSGSGFYLYDAAVQALKVNFAAPVSTIYGGATSADVLKLQANTSNTYPYVKLTGAGGIGAYLQTANAFTVYDATDSAIKMMGSGTNGYIYGPAATGKTLYLYANATDSNPFISMTGLGDLNLNVDTYVRGYDVNSGQIFKVGRTGDTSYLYGTSTTGGSFRLTANDTDTFPYTVWNGHATATSIASYLKGGSFYVYIRDTTDASNLQRFKVRATSDAQTSIYGGNVTGDTLKIYPNSADAYPYFYMYGNSSTYLHMPINGKFEIDARNAADSAHLVKFKLVSTSDTRSTLSFGDVSGDDAIIRPSGANTYPYIIMTGNADMQLRANTANPIHFYDGATSMARILMSGTNTYLYGPAATLKNLTLTANYADTYPVLTLDGSNGNIVTYLRTGSKFKIYDAATEMFSFYSGGGETIIDSTLSGNNWLRLFSKLNWIFRENTNNREAVRITSAANATVIYGGPATTGDTATIYANQTDTYPRMVLAGNTYLALYNAVGSSTRIYDGATLSHRFNYASNVSNVIGGTVAGDSIVLQANNSDTYPYMKLVGGTYAFISFKSGATFRLYDEGTMAYYFAHSANNSKMYGGGVTGDVLEIHPNTIDATPYIKMNGLLGIELITTAGSYVQFGVYAATGDTASNGYITIKDAAGNTRKLMTCA